MKSLKTLLATDSAKTSIGLIRVALAFVIFPHGAQKLLGWFQGYGFAGTMQYFTEYVGLPWLLGLIIILIEFFGALLLLVGLLSRLVSLGIIAIMAGAVVTTHLQNGFFMNWEGNQAGEGIEFFVLVIAMSAAVAIAGGGKGSLDAVIAKRLKN